LDITISLAHRAKYKLNPNYAAMVKQDIDKLLTLGFIQSMEEATGLSSIAISTKAKWEVHNLCGF
jgi:hypothetical protein